MEPKPMESQSHGTVVEGSDPRRTKIGVFVLSKSVD